jgi:hypothetical protein
MMWNARCSIRCCLMSEAAMKLMPLIFLIAMALTR